MNNSVGEVYGKLTIIKLSRTVQYQNPNTGRRNGIKYVECSCSCGQTIETRLNDIKSGKVVSCGCSKGTHLLKDIVGKRFSRLVVLERTSSRKWLCQCDCGNTHEVKTCHLNNASIRSCGCLRDETTSAMSIKNLKRLREESGFDPSTPMTNDSDIQRAVFNKLVKEVLARDSNCCTWCNNTSGSSKLNVHHIKQWMYFPDLRFDQKNLVTLCTTCHKLVHNRGYHANPDTIMSMLLQGYANNIEDYNSTSEVRLYDLQ